MHKPTLLALLLACGTVHAESVQLIREHGIFVVPVKITLNFTIDSGASDVSIPADLFSTLTRAGTVAKSDILDTQLYEVADGSKQQSQWGGQFWTPISPQTWSELHAGIWLRPAVANSTFIANV